MRRIIVLLVVALAAVAMVVVSAQATPSATVLKGEVNDAFQVKLMKNGVRVKTLKAGKYTLQVNDKSSSHNFRLKGPGITRKTATGVGFVGKRSFSVTLRAGRYTIQCDPHATQMRGTFRVTA